MLSPTRPHYRRCNAPRRHSTFALLSFSPSLFSFHAYFLSFSLFFSPCVSSLSPPSPRRSRRGCIIALSRCVVWIKCACACYLRAFWPRFRNVCRRVPSTREFAMVTSERIWISAHFVLTFNLPCFPLFCFPATLRYVISFVSSWNNATGRLERTRITKNLL